MKNKFLQISLGASIMMLSAGFLLRSIGPVQASQTPLNTFREGTITIGKYQVELSSVLSQNNQMWTYAVILNTETGISKTYLKGDLHRKWDEEMQLPVADF